MSDGLQHMYMRMEGLSCVYVQALAASAGYLTSTPKPDVDSVDMTIHGGGSMRPKLDLQLKATTKLKVSGAGPLPFRLKHKNYEELRLPTQTPRLLIVLALPEDESSWINVSAEALTLRCCTYWMSLQGNGHKERECQETVTAHIPQVQQFDIGTLRALMDQSRQGDIL